MGIVEREAELLELRLIHLEHLVDGLLAVVILRGVLVGADKLGNLFPHVLALLSREFSLFFGTRSIAET